MSIKHILFDLDGTLLPMKQEEFVMFYMPLLAKAYMDSGFSIEVETFLKAVWKGYEAMIGNDGSCTNREVFWRYLEPQLPMGREKAEQIAEIFYSEGFNQAACMTKPTPLAAKAVRAAKKNGKAVYLATNPVFPRVGTLNRIRWAGLDASDFALITTYEDNCFCKPNPLYFQAILEQFRLKPEECLMIGNDVEEDLSIRSLGVKTFLVTDTMENKKNLPIKTEYQGSMETLTAFLESLPG